MAITSREDLKDYALRRLGFPVIEINVDDAQVEDRIDDAIQFFSEYHFDGVEEAYLPYVITQTDVDNKYINTNNISAGSSGGNIISISKVFIVDQAVQSGMFSVQYQLMLNDYFNGFLTGTSNRVTNKLKINTDWSETFKVGDKLMVQAYVALNPETYPEIYNDILLKRYVTALIKRQWASNLSKFSNIALPGGMQFDARAMYNDSMTELTQIEDTVQSKYELPTDFMVG